MKTDLHKFLKKIDKNILFDIGGFFIDYIYYNAKGDRIEVPEKFASILDAEKIKELKILVKKIDITEQKYYPKLISEINELIFENYGNSKFENQVEDFFKEFKLNVDEKPIEKVRRIMIKNNEFEITTRRRKSHPFYKPRANREKPLRLPEEDKYKIIQEIKLPNGIIIEVKSKNLFPYSKVPKILLEELIKFYK